MREHATRAIANLTELHNWEYEALLYIHHSGGRIRGSINHSGLDGLARLKIIVTEEKKRPIDVTDCIWVFPAPIKALLRDKLGEPDRKKRAKRPPWEKSTRI